jgi:hypothetical protein
MRGQSGIITLALLALLIGGCATRSEMMRDNTPYPYENTDRPIMPRQNTNRPIMALDFGADECAAAQPNSPWQGLTLPSSRPAAVG